MSEQMRRNVLNTELEACCVLGRSGYFRDGFCRTEETDLGRHSVCAEMTEDFLKYTKAQGNDLSTPRPEWNFPGLQPGDFWCICASRWLEAEQAGFAPFVRLEATELSTLDLIPLETLKKYAN